MKKILLLALMTGVLFAQTNNINGNTINTGGGNVNVNQFNSKISKEEIDIDKQIDNEMMKVLSSSIEQSSKNMTMQVLHKSKQINQKQISVEEKNRECKFNAEMQAKIFKYANVKLSFSYCDKIF